MGKQFNTIKINERICYKIIEGKQCKERNNENEGCFEGWNKDEEMNISITKKLITRCGHHDFPKAAAGSQLAQLVMTAQTVKTHLDTLNPSPTEAEEGEEAG